MCAAARDTPDYGAIAGVVKCERDDDAITLGQASKDERGIGRMPSDPDWTRPDKGL